MKEKLLIRFNNGAVLREKRRLRYTVIGSGKCDSKSEERHTWRLGIQRALSSIINLRMMSIKDVRLSLR